MVLIYLFRILSRAFVPRFLKKIYIHWKQKGFECLSPEKREFIELNEAFWEKQNRKNDDGYVLVDGFFASYGSNYLLRTGIIAKAIEEELLLTPLVLLNNHIENEKEKILLYKSFSIDCFESVLNYYPSFLCRIRYLIVSLKYFFFIKKPEDLFGLEYKGIVFGDILYDTILKNAPGTYTVSAISLRELFYINEALIQIEIANNILGRNSIKFYITTHVQYLEYGILSRVCLSKNVPVMESTDIQSWLHQKRNDNKSISYPRYHECLGERIKAILKNEGDKVSIVKIEKMLRERFSAQFDQSDVRLAYKNKKVYGRQELCDVLTIHNGHPFCFIFAHIFSDTPRGSGNGMLYRDFYAWMEETVKVVRTIPNVNWVVRPHPASAIYNEVGKVDEILRKYHGENIFLCPADLSPESLINVASAIITVQGTVGLEYGCMGIPVILAGRPFYSGFGFTTEPDSVEEYISVLKGIVTFPRLSEDQKCMAKKIFAAFMRTQQSDTSLVDSDVLLSVWGGGGAAPSSDRSFRLMNQKLRGHDLKEYSLYKNTKDLVKHLRLSK